MSKQTGLIRLDGKIGGISFYRADGQDLARIAKGPSKARILNDPAFVRTRENNVEFGGSSRAAKAMRLALVHVLEGMSDPYLASRLTKVFRQVITRSTGIRGQRPIALSANRVMLEGFEFDGRHSFSSVFNAPFSLSNNVERTEGGVSVHPFLPSSLIHSPSGATHFRLVTAMGIVSDYVYDTVTGTYEATDPNIHTLHAVAYGAMTALNTTLPVNFSLATVLPGTPVMTGSMSVVQCLGIEFFTRGDTMDYRLAEGNALKIVKLF